jgi:hypothetical protein
VLFLVISLLNFVLETSPHFRIPYDIATNKTLTRKQRDELTAPHPILRHIELICNLFFATEMLMRFLASPNRKKFLKNPYNLLELLAIFPLFWPVETLENKNSFGVVVHNYIEVFYILRILRIFTLVPKYSGLRILLLALRNSIGEFVLYLVMLIMTIMIYASFIYYAEQIYEDESNKFDSILIGLWWAVVTTATLGYGDYVPVTPLGYIVGGMCAVTGLIFLGLPIPIIVQNFAMYYGHAKAREKLLKHTSEQRDLLNRAIALHFQTVESKVCLNCCSCRTLLLLLLDAAKRRRIAISLMRCLEITTKSISLSLLANVGKKSSKASIYSNRRRRSDRLVFFSWYLMSFAFLICQSIKS